MTAAKKKRKSYVRDRKLLGIIGCTGQHDFAVYNEIGGQASDMGFLEVEDESDEVPDYDDEDNGGCTYDYNSVSNGYNGRKGCFHGDILAYRKLPTDKYAVRTGIYSVDGR